MAAASFFAKLPTGKLTPAEANLRDLLLRAATAAKKLLPPRGGVSLQEWVEKRMPGEVNLGTDVSGNVMLLPLARVADPEKPASVALPTPKASPPSSEPKGAEAFFGELPTDAFAPEEEKLRSALAGLLAQGPLQAAEAAKDPEVAAAARGFLPRSVPLAEWVEKRIGGEVLVGEDQELRLISGKDERREAFFGSLPTDSFSKEEEQLRTALFDFLATWRSKELANLSNVGGDRAVQQARARLLPPGVALREWIERRIGGEVELRPDRKGQFVVHLTSAARPLVSRRFQELERPEPEAREAREAQETTTRTDFFEGLPPDELLPKELELREALLGFVQSWEESHGGQPPVLAAAGQDRTIQRCKAALLPPTVALQAWIEHRIGGEVQTRPHANGQLMICLRRRGRRGAGGGVGGGADEAPSRENEGERVPAAERREAFFAELPTDSFTPEEEALRQALLAFLGRWEDADPPTLSNAGGDRAVHDARTAFLPKGCGASLKEWIDRRIGGEIETSVPEGSGMQVVFGLRGQLDRVAAARVARKRRADGERVHPGGGAGGKGGKASGGIIGMDPAMGPPWKKGR